jgi:hypothetical protein
MLAGGAQQASKSTRTPLAKNKGRVPVDTHPSKLLPARVSPVTGCYQLARLVKQAWSKKKP